MKAVISIKTGKGKKSTEKEIDKSVKVVEKIANRLEKQGWKPKSCKVYCDGETAVLER